MGVPHHALWEQNNCDWTVFLYGLHFCRKSQPKGSGILLKLQRYQKSGTGIPVRHSRSRSRSRSRLYHNFYMYFECTLCCSVRSTNHVVRKLTVQLYFMILFGNVCPRTSPFRYFVPLNLWNTQTKNELYAKYVIKVFYDCVKIAK